MDFGNWTVTDNTIEWTAEGTNKIAFPKESLLTTQQVHEVGVLYETILLATNEDWLTQNDLYDLNYAFVFAAAKFKLPFDYEIFDATLEVQYEQFEGEEDEE